VLLPAWLPALGLVLLGYIIGATPFAYVLASRFAGVDVRRAGSGNVGAANVWRTASRKLAIFAALLDMAKGLAVVLLARGAGQSETVVTAAGVASVVGHIYPLWLRFHGGKGVATACGVFAGLAPRLVWPAAAVFLLTVWLTRYASAGSVAGMLTLMILALSSDSSPAIVLGACVTTALVIFRHRENLKRLMTGTERRLRHP